MNFSLLHAENFTLLRVTLSYWFLFNIRLPVQLVIWSFYSTAFYRHRGVHSLRRCLIMWTTQKYPFRHVILFRNSSKYSCVCHNKYTGGSKQNDVWINATETFSTCQSNKYASPGTAIGWRALLIYIHMMWLIRHGFIYKRFDIMQMLIEYPFVYCLKNCTLRHTAAKLGNLSR